MRVDVLKIDRLRLGCSAAALVLLTLASGCSSDVARFDDGFYTGAVPQQTRPRADIGRSQPYPGDIDRVNTGSVGRQGYGAPGAASGLGPRSAQGYGGQPYPESGGGGDGNARRYASSDGGYGRSSGVERSMLPPPPASPSAPPVYSAPQPSLPPRAPSGASEAAPRPPITSAAKAGWNKSGTSVALRDGETIDTLSSRYGVPAKAILTANGLHDASEARTGQQIAIPSYSYGASPSSARRTATAQTVGERSVGAPPAALHAPSAAVPRTGGIVVSAGDSLRGIAHRTGVSVDALRSVNNLENDNIRIGQTLVLPKGASQPDKQVAALEPKAAKPAAKTTPQVPETPAAKPKPYEAPHAAAAKSTPAEPAPAAAAKPETPATSVEAEAETDVATATPAGTGIDQFRWPVQGRVVSRFGDKAGARRSDGLDISVPQGTPVKAAENGVVIYAGDGLKEFGNTILVKHDNGLVTVYGHADNLKVKRGETVRRGEEIATAGMSGDTDTPMVHFEVRKNSAPVDPMKFLK